MSTLSAVLLTVLIAFVAVAAVIIIAVSLSFAKKQRPSDIHYNGGADVDSGRLVSDKNYFKGVSHSGNDTYAVNGRRKMQSGVYITVTNLSDGRADRLALEKELFFGRSESANDYRISDRAASGRHFVIYLSEGALYISDLESSNHTYLNGKRVYKSARLNSGDTVKAGNTRMKITF